MAQKTKNPPAIQETWVWSLGQEDPLEKEIAFHSNILAWEILWPEEPGGLQSVGLQRVGHNWATEPTHRHQEHVYVNPNRPIHPSLPFPLGYLYICSLYLCFYFCLVNKMVYTNFLRLLIYALIYGLFFSFWLTSCYMTVSRSIHVSTNDPISFLFMVE